MGAQVEIKGSIARAARVLDALAAAPHGASLTQIVAQTGFTKTTTFRVLSSLQDVFLVEQDPASSQYRLGRKLAQLGRSAARVDVAELAAPGLQRLAGISQDTVFLSVPEGAASVCVARQVGAFPIRTLTLNVGDRRPLGVGAGALALLCEMTGVRQRAVLRANTAWLAEFGFSGADVEALCHEYRDMGHAINKGRVVPGMSAVAVPVRGKGRANPVAAIAIGAINERMSAKRIRTVLLPALRQEAERLEGYMNET